MNVKDSKTKIIEIERTTGTRKNRKMSLRAVYDLKVLTKSNYLRIEITNRGE